MRELIGLQPEEDKEPLDFGFSLANLISNLKFLGSRLGSHDRAIEVLSQESGVLSSRIREIIHTPWAISFNSLRSHITGKPINPEDIFADPNADTPTEAMQDMQESIY